MLGQLAASKAKRPAASLPSGRRSSKFARLAVLPAAPAAPRPVAHVPATWPEPQPDGERGGKAVGAQRVPAPVTPPVAPFLHVCEILCWSDSELTPTPLPDMEVYQPFVFASDEEISASRWKPVIAPQPRTAAFGAPPELQPCGGVCIFELVARNQANSELQPPFQVFNLISSKELLTTEAVFGDNRLRLQPLVVPPLSLQHSLPQIREGLAADAAVVDGMSIMLADALFFAERAVRLCALAFGCSISNAEEGACTRAAAGTSRDADTGSSSFELEPITSSAALVCGVPGVDALPLLDDMPEPAYRQLRPFAQQTFAFCAMDKLEISARADELVGLCLNKEEPSAVGFDAASLDLEPLEGKGVLLATAGSLGQFTFSRLADASPGLALLSDQCCFGELMPPSAAAPLASLGQLWRADTHIIRELHAVPANRLGTERSLLDARGQVDKWMAEGAGNERVRAPESPKLPPLDMRVTFEMPRRQHALGNARISRLASSDKALEAARQRLLGFLPAEKPADMPSSVARGCTIVWFVEHIEQRDPVLEGASFSLMASSAPVLLEQMDPAEALCDAPGPAERTVGGNSSEAVCTNGASPLHAYHGGGGAEAVDDGCAGTARADATAHGHAVLSVEDGDCDLRMPAASHVEKAAPALHFVHAPASSKVDQQDEMIANFMQLRQKGLPPAAPQSLANKAEAADAVAACNGVAFGVSGGAKEQLADLAEEGGAGDYFGSATAHAQTAAAVQQPAHAPRLQLCVGERARQFRSPVLVGLASRGITWCDRAFWTPCLQLSSTAAAVFVDSADLLEQRGAPDVLEELHLLAATYTRCWLLVDDGGGLATATDSNAPEVVMQVLSQIVIAARSIPFIAIPSVYNCQSELCDLITRVVKLECAADARAASPSPLMQHESVDEQLLCCFFNPIASMRVLSAARWERGRELASFLQLTPSQRRELFPWLHPVGLDALASMSARTPAALLPQNANDAAYLAATATQLQYADGSAPHPGDASCAALWL